MTALLADPNSGDDLAARNIATGPPSDFWENFSAAWNASRLNDRVIGEQTALSEEYDRFNEDVFKSSGQRLPNPMEHELPPGVNRIDLTGDPRIPIDTATAIRLYEDYARKLGAKPPTLQEFRDRASGTMRDVEQQRAEVETRAGDERAGQTLGSMAAITTDPPLLVSMMFGGGEATSVLRLMGREALIAGGVETAAQVPIQSARVEAGLPGGFEQGAENVGLAMLGAGALSGTFRGLGTSFRALRDLTRKAKPVTSADMDALRYAERHSDLHSENPLPETAEGVGEHTERVSAAQRRLYERDADAPDARLADEPRSYVPPRERAPAPELPDDVPAAAAVRDLADKFAEPARNAAHVLDAFKANRSLARQLGDLPDEAINISRGPAPVEPQGDQSLVQFVIRNGGVSDERRALASIGVTPRLRPGLIRKSGMSLSKMSELASEAGYFPAAGPGEGGRVVDERELATAISDELGGQKLFARHGQGGEVGARVEYEANAAIHEHLNRAFQELEIDPRRLTNAQVRSAVREIAGAPDPVPELRTDFAEEAKARVERTEADLDAQAEMEERIAIAAEKLSREEFAGRMDEPVYIEVGGEIRAVPAREIFRSLDDDANLVREFTNCLEGIPF